MKFFFFWTLILELDYNSIIVYIKSYENLSIFFYPYIQYFTPLTFCKKKKTVFTQLYNIIKKKNTHIVLVRFELRKAG